jgi:uncharacterized protein
MCDQRGFQIQNSGCSHQNPAGSGMTMDTVGIRHRSIFRATRSFHGIPTNQQPDCLMASPVAVLSSAKTIAVVGISSNPSRISHVVATYLKDAGYTVIPINPGHKELLDVPCYPDLTSVPADVSIDVVDIFRRPEFTAGVVAQVAERASRTGNRPVVWTQIGVSSPEAQQAASDAGLPYIANTCTMAVHKANL